MIRTRFISPISICLALLVASLANVAQAESLRCGNKLALQDDTRIAVRAKCGEPSDVAHSTLMRRTLGNHGSHRRAAYSEEEIVAIPVEVWTYNLGSHRLMCRLRFVNGVLERLETIGYGFDNQASQ